VFSAGEAIADSLVEEKSSPASASRAAPTSRGGGHPHGSG